MIFNEGYYTPMDRNYGVINTPESDPKINAEVPLQIEPKRQNININPEDLAIGVVQLQPGAETLKARIWGGASKVELGFAGQGKGSQQGLTPGSFSREEREAIRDLARINKVETSTHAAVNISGLSGFNQNEFNEQFRKQTLDEVKRAVDFAAEATSGGVVVVHTGEFPRALTKVPDRGMFKGHQDEEKEAVSYLVDSHSGRLIQAVREDEVAWLPVQNLENVNGVKKKVWMKDGKGEDQRDEFIISYNDQMEKEYKKDNKHWDRIEERIPRYEKTEEGFIKTEAVKYADFREKLKNDAKFIAKHPKALTEEHELDKWASVEFFKHQREGEIQRALGGAREFENYYHQGIDSRPKLLKAIEVYKKIMEATPDNEKWKLSVEDYSLLQAAGARGLVPPNIKNPVEFLETELLELDRRIAYGRESSVGGRLQARQIQDQMRYVKPVEEYAKGKTSDSIAETAVYAWRRQEQENRKREKMGIEKLKPIFISPENLFPEQYGSHPEETGNMVAFAREEMIKKLWDEKSGKAKVAGITSAKQAADLAKTHIKATIDVGHLNMWRKYWKEDLKKTPEVNEKAFQEWAVSRLKSLVDKGYVGNIHMHDNFGFHDEHVEIGRGTAPIEEYVKVLKEGGLGKDIVIEINSTNINTALPHAMAQFGSPVYAAGARLPVGAPNQFDQMRGAYGGQAQSPFYVVGAYSPSEDWRLWTETPLE